MYRCTIHWVKTPARKGMPGLAGTPATPETSPKTSATARTSPTPGTPAIAGTSDSECVQDNLKGPKHDQIE
jgi:hypothetical protein